MRKWQLQDAKARLSELVRLSQGEGPQGISVRGESVAVLISRRDYDRLTSPQPTLAEFLRDSPLHGVELEMDRDRSPTRELPR